MSKNQAVGIIIVEKGGSLKQLNIKDYNEEELFKKCGFKKADHFSKQTTWSVKVDGIKYSVSIYAKTEGKANTENKYDFPPPIDTTLFFGNCAIVCSQYGDDKIMKLCSMSIPIWDKIYEKLFGGFEDLAATCAEDENEIDELDNVPADKKTKHGYLKDGFVVDSDSDELGDESEDSSEELEDESEELEGLELEDIGSELSEDDYDYSDSDEEENVVVQK